MSKELRDHLGTDKMEREFRWINIYMPISAVTIIVLVSASACAWEQGYKLGKAEGELNFYKSNK